MTIGGAIEDIKSWDIPFYCEKSREKVIETIVEAYQEGAASERPKAFSNGYESGYSKGRADATKWIPCSERLPEEIDAVNITWVNRNPPTYYEHIKDKEFNGTAHYFHGKWYWYSSTTLDYLKEYGESEWDKMDEDIDVIAWMPLPEPYKEQMKGEAE